MGVRYTVRMMTPEDLKARMLAICPDFPDWNHDEWQLWSNEDGTASIHQLFVLFSHYISEQLEAGTTAGLDTVFHFVEQAVTADDETLSNAATTCFLENIMNRVPERISPATFVPLLGPESRSFCKAWDEWCGTKTAGLW